MSVRATLHEHGNGFPDVGDYVAGDDGELYRVVELSTRIHTGAAPGQGAFIHGQVELADWSDLSDEDEDDVVCSAVLCEVAS